MWPPDKCGIRICVESTLIGWDYMNSPLHTYPCHDTDKCGQCHTYPEAELFIQWGTFKYQKGQLKPHSSSHCCWEPYEVKIIGSKPFKHPTDNHNQGIMSYNTLHPRTQTCRSESLNQGLPLPPQGAVRSVPIVST